MKYQFQKELALFSKSCIDSLTDTYQEKHIKKKTLYIVEDLYYEMTAVAFIEYDSSYKKRMECSINQKR